MANAPFNNPFSSTGNDTPKGETGKGSSAVDIMDYLSSDKDTPAKEPEVKEEVKEVPDDDDVDGKDTKDDESDEIDIKDDVDDDKEEKLDLDTKDKDSIEVDVPPKKSEILKEFPEFFKKFPAVEKMIYRDREWTELLGTLDDAKELVARAEDMSQFESQILSGRTDDLLKRVKEADPKAFDKIVDNYLETLEKIDKDAYIDVMAYSSKNIIIGMLNEAKREGNDELHKAAAELHKYLFGNTDLTKPTKRVAEVKDEARSALDKEKQEFVQQKFETSRDELQAKVDNVLKSTINDHIDPRGVLSAYEKRNAIKDVLHALHAEIGKDPAYSKNLQRLWSNVFDKNFSKDSIDLIRKSYLGKSKGLIGSVIKKIRAEVLNDKSRKRVEKDEEETPSEPRKTTNAGRPSQQTGSKAKSQRQPGESVADFFARD